MRWTLMKVAQTNSWRDPRKQNILVIKHNDEPSEWTAL